MCTAEQSAAVVLRCRDSSVTRIQFMQPSPACSTPRSSIVRPLLLGILVVVVGIACLDVLIPFLAAITWAAILAYTSWPLYRRVRKLFGSFTTVAASLMTLLLTCAVVIPVLWMLVLVGEELIAAYRAFAQLLADTPNTLPGFIQRIPWLGESLQQQIDRYSGEPVALVRQQAFGYVRGPVSSLPLRAELDVTLRNRWSRW